MCKTFWKNSAEYFDPVNLSLNALYRLLKMNQCFFYFLWDVLCGYIHHNRHVSIVHCNPPLVIHTLSCIYIQCISGFLLYSISVDSDTSDQSDTLFFLVISSRLNRAHSFWYQTRCVSKKKLHTTCCSPHLRWRLSQGCCVTFLQVEERNAVRQSRVWQSVASLTPPLN